MPITNLVGQQYGLLIVLGDSGRRTSSGTVRWICECTACRCRTVRSPRDLRKTPKCKCQLSQTARQRFTTHGATGTLGHRIWVAMHRRCYDENNKDFHHYGGRGISVCFKWMSFEGFIADMGQPSPRMSLERINRDGNYEPGNCKWATRKEQANNTRRNRRLEWNNETKTMAQWANDTAVKYGISYTLLRARLRLGWPIHQALTTPPGAKKPSS